MLLRCFLESVGDAFTLPFGGYESIKRTRSAGFRFSLHEVANETQRQQLPPFSINVSVLPNYK